MCGTSSLTSTDRPQAVRQFAPKEGGPPGLEAPVCPNTYLDKFTLYQHGNK